MLLGELVIDKEPPIELYVELPRDQVVKKAAAMKDRLAFLLDTRFRPSDPEPPNSTDLTVEEVAELFHCRVGTVLRMIRRGHLHPRTGDDGESYFDRAEVERVNRAPLSAKLSRFVSLG